MVLNTQATIATKTNRKIIINLTLIHFDMADYMANTAYLTMVDIITKEVVFTYLASYAGAITNTITITT